MHLHFHILFLEGVYLDRTTVDLKPRFIQAAPPTDTDIAEVVRKISRRVIRTLRRLGYLETGVEPPVATGYDPLRDTAPELARTMAAFLLVIPGSTLIGLGIGMLTSHRMPNAVIGCGAGMLLWGLIVALTK